MGIGFLGPKKLRRRQLSLRCLHTVRQRKENGRWHISSSAMSKKLLRRRCAVETTMAEAKPPSARGGSRLEVAIRPHRLEQPWQQANERRAIRRSVGNVTPIK